MISKKCRIAFLPLFVKGEAFAGQEKPSFDDVYVANAMAQGRYDQDLAVRLLALDMSMTFYMQYDAHCRQSLRWRVWYATHDDDFFDAMDFQFLDDDGTKKKKKKGARQQEAALPYLRWPTQGLRL